VFFPKCVVITSVYFLVVPPGWDVIVKLAGSLFADYGWLYLLDYDLRYIGFIGTVNADMDSPFANHGAPPLMSHAVAGSYCPSLFLCKVLGCASMNIWTSLSLANLLIFPSVYSRYLSSRPLFCEKSWLNSFQGSIMIVSNP